MAKKKTPKQVARPDNDFLTFVDDDGRTQKLTMKQKLFGEYYLEFRGNATKAAREAGYSARNYKVLQRMGSENLSKPLVKAYIRYLLKDEGLNDEYVDRELLVAIRQDTQISGKVQGIKEYNKIRGRYSPEERETTHKFDLTDEQLDALIDAKTRKT